MEVTDIAAQLPRRINELLMQIDKLSIRLDVEVFDEQTFMSGFQKVGNRITAGMILGSLIIGAALLMRIETSVKLLGYPVLAIVLFLAAALGGVMLL
jgi:ubiquinone biosynthesis protein